MDNEYLWGIVLQQKQHLLLATVTVLLCTASNLAAPVLSGMLFEHLVQQNPMQKYAQVWVCNLAAKPAPLGPPTPTHTQLP